MPAFLVSLVSIAGFCAAFHFLKLVAVSQKGIQAARKGMFSMLDSTLSEEEKETAVQSAGLTLLRTTFDIVWRLIGCLIMAAVPIYFFDKTQLVSAQAVTDLMLRWDYIAVTSAALVGLSWILASTNKKTPIQPTYSLADQFIHRLAFSGSSIQRRASNLEDRLFAKKIQSKEDRAPIFITSLPRAGTTVLLIALNRLPNLATHLYRDMPFVMSPLLWSRMSGLFRKKSIMRERAHGDGIKIGYDSPEAFEEIFWKEFWPEKYESDRIALWQSDDTKPEAQVFFNRHFRKMVALRSNGVGRYVSKNNGNIARLALLPTMFPGAQIIVPLREPAEHAASLFRQHLNFKNLHGLDPFIESYMRDIGHFEFGNLHKPFSFNHFDGTSCAPEESDYWLDYWIAAYETVLGHAEKLHIISHEKLCNNPQETMQRLLETLQLDSDDHDFTSQFRPIPKKAKNGLFDSKKFAKATDLYQALLQWQV